MAGTSGSQSRKREWRPVDGSVRGFDAYANTSISTSSRVRNPVRQCVKQVAAEEEKRKKKRGRGKAGSLTIKGPRGHKYQTGLICASPRLRTRWPETLVDDRVDHPVSMAMYGHISPRCLCSSNPTALANSAQNLKTLHHSDLWPLVVHDSGPWRPTLFLGLLDGDESLLARISHVGAAHGVIIALLPSAASIRPYCMHHSRNAH
ncbi:hypothetical protein C8Q79DRAFT_612268 [Trametes meyenii]|nr:hypothetical protein C8Q79DRAFT_612268 [Trametes meyenii]